MLRPNLSGNRKKRRESGMAALCAYCVEARTSGATAFWGDPAIRTGAGWRSYPEGPTPPRFFGELCVFESRRPAWREKRLNRLKGLAKNMVVAEARVQAAMSTVEPSVHAQAAWARPRISKLRLCAHAARPPGGFQRRWWPPRPWLALSLAANDPSTLRSNLLGRMTEAARRALQSE